LHITGNFLQAWLDWPGNGSVHRSAPGNTGRQGRNGPLDPFASTAGKLHNPVYALGGGLRGARGPQTWIIVLTLRVAIQPSTLQRPTHHRLRDGNHLTTQSIAG
jgi:hypothetical protein